MAHAVRHRRPHGTLCSRQWKSSWLLLAALGYACTHGYGPACAQRPPETATAQAADTLTIKLATVQWASPTCGPDPSEVVFQTALSVPVWCGNSCINVLPGLRLAMQKLGSKQTAVRDTTGRTYSLNFTLIIKDNMCNLTHHELMLQQLAQRERPHFYIQGLVRTASIENAVTAAAGRILLHSMTLSDAVAARKPDTAFTMMPAPGRSLNTLIKAMASNGIRSLAVGYVSDSIIALSYCGPLPSYAESIQPFAPGFNVSSVFTYNVTSGPSYVEGLEESLRKAAAQGAEALLMCTAGPVDAIHIHDAIRNVGIYFKAIYIQHFDTDAMDHLYNTTGSRRSAEGFMSLSMWDPNVPYFDEVLGNASAYVAEFKRAHNREPVFYSAFASASVVVIRNAVRLALQMCDLSNAAQDMEAFLFNATYSVCFDPVTGSRTTLSVYQLMYNRLATSYIETVAGPVGFNRQGVNDQLPTLTMQVQNGELKVAYPIEVSNAPLIMPLPAPPPPPMPPRPPQPQVTIVYSDQSWASSGAGIAVIVSLCVGVPLLVAALTFNWYFCWHRGKRKHLCTFKDLVTIPSDQLLVRCPPQQGQAGTGTYKHSLAVELLCMMDNRQLMDTDASQVPRRGGLPFGQGQERTASVSFVLGGVGGGAPNGSITAADSGDPGTSARPRRSRLALSPAHADHSSGTASPADAPVTPRTPRTLQHAERGDEPEPGTATRRGSNLGRSRSHAKIVSFDEIVVASVSHPGAGRAPASNEHNAIMASSQSGVTSTSGPAMSTAPGPGAGAGAMIGTRARSSTGGGPGPGADVGVCFASTAGAGSRGPPPPPPTLTDKQLERMAEHVWTYMKIPHERLVPIHGIMWSEPVSPLGPLLVSERPELGTLASVLANDMLELEVHTRAYICLQVAEALDFMHSQDMFLRSPVMPTVHLAQGLRAKVSLTHLAQAWAAPSFQQDLAKSFSHTPTGVREKLNPLSQQQSRRGEAVFSASAGGVNGQGPASDLRSRMEDVAAFGAFVCQVFRHALPQSETLLATMDSSIAVDDSAQDDIEFVPELLRPLVRECLAMAAVAKVVASRGPSSRRLTLEVLRPQFPDTGASKLPKSDAKSCHPSGGLSGSRDDPGAPVAPEAAKSVGACVGASADGAPATQPLQPQGAGGPSEAPQMMCMADVVARLRVLIGELVEVAAQDGQVSSTPVQLANMVKSTQRSENMLSEFFPPKVARQLQLGLPVQPEPYEEVAIFFSDICGYTQLCSQLNAAEVMDLLHRLYTSLDAITRELRLFKVETIGDAYMAVSNIKVHDPDAHARAMTIFALSAVEAANSTAVHPQRPELGTVNIRVGLHSGPVVASVVGTLNRRYCLFGDAVNVAARMESSSERNMVHCSRDFAKLVAKQWPQVVTESRGLRDIKGKGQMETFFLKPPKGFMAMRGTSSGGQAVYGVHPGQGAQSGQQGHPVQGGQLGKGVGCEPVSEAAETPAARAGRSEMAALDLLDHEEAWESGC